jgi:hypothetical protein
MLETVELACGLKFDMVEHGLSYGPNHRPRRYEHHQGSCNLCAKIPFRWIMHIKYNVKLRCGLQCTSLKRADFNAHRSQCNKCKHIIFRFVQTNLERVSASCCGKKLYRDYDQFLARCTTKRNVNEILRCANIDRYSLETGMLHIGFNHSMIPVPHVVQTMPPSFSCSIAPLGPGYIRIHINLFDTKTGGQATNFYDIAPIPENIWILFRRNIICDLQTHQNIHLHDTCASLLPSDILCLLSEYDVFDSYETLCVITRCLVSLWECNLEMLQQCNVPRFYSFVSQNSSFLNVLQNDWNVSLMFTKFLERANDFYNQVFVQK